MRKAGRNEYTVGHNEYEKRGAFIVTRYLSRRGAHLSQRGIYRDAARHVATKTPGNPHPAEAMAGYTRTRRRRAGKSSRGPRRPRPYSRGERDVARRLPPKEVGEELREPDPEAADPEGDPDGCPFDAVHQPL